MNELDRGGQKVQTSSYKISTYYGYDVQHILYDGTLASHSALEKNLIEELRHSKKYHLAETNPLFGSYTEEEQRRDAYRLKNKEIGYRLQEESEID